MSTVDTAAADLFADQLVLEERRAVAFVPGAPADADAVVAQGLALMRALAVIEDAAPRGDTDDAAAESALSRLEAKVDLLTALVGALAAGMQPGDALHAIRWTAAGAALPCVAATGAVSGGDAGLLRIAPSLLLPTPLAIPATVVVSDERQLLLRFDPPAPAFAEALERLVFRIHRREVARQRALTSA